MLLRHCSRQHQPMFLADTDRQGSEGGNESANVFPSVHSSGVQNKRSIDSVTFQQSFIPAERCFVWPESGDACTDVDDPIRGDMQRIDCLRSGRLRYCQNQVGLSQELQMPQIGTFVKLILQIRFRVE